MTVFSVTHRSTDRGARCGLLPLPHAPEPIQTPVFMPVGTRGTVKAMTQEEVWELGLSAHSRQHLPSVSAARPVNSCKQAGGLHKFIAWDGAMLTDSGGFQVFSLEELRKITEEGVKFKSHLDGSEHFFSPERSIEVQHGLGADIIMAFDECPPYPCTEELTRAATERTHRWLERCEPTTTHKERGSSCSGSRRGGRTSTCGPRAPSSWPRMDTPGIAVGGVSVGEPPEMMQEAVGWSIPHLPPHKPRYLMGVGTPRDILDAVAQGVDMFDCVLPTRLGRNGTLYTTRGRINIKGSRYTDDFGPVDPNCACRVCRRYSAAYLRHLYKCDEILGLPSGDIPQSRPITRSSWRAFGRRSPPTVTRRSGARRWRDMRS